jgi:hypothetical protein
MRASQSVADILDFAIRLLWFGGWNHHLHVELMENVEEPAAARMLSSRQIANSLREMEHGQIDAPLIHSTRTPVWIKMANMVHNRKLSLRKRGAAGHRRGERVMRDAHDLAENTESDHKHVGRGR